MKQIRNVTKLCVATVLFCGATTLIHGDQVELNNGKVMNGEIEKETSEYILFNRIENSVMRIDRNEIKSLNYADTGPAPRNRDGGNVKTKSGFLSKLKVEGLYGYGLIGMHGVDIDDLNSRLKSQDYNALNTDPYINFGGGGYVVFNSLVLGMEGALMTQSATSSTINGTKYNGTVTSGYIVGRGGILFVKTDFLHLFPYVGVGGSGVNVMFNPTKDKSFNAALSDPENGTIMSTFTFLMQFGIEITGRVPIFTVKNSDVGLFGGIQGGYALSFLNSDWILGGINDRAVLSNGPAAGSTGWYARIIGGAYLSF